MNDISGKKVIKNISWLIADKVFLLLFSLIVVIKIANHYGPSEYGLYQYALSINTLLGVVILFVDGRVVMKRYKDKNEGHIIFNTTIAKVILSVITLIIGVAILILINKGYKFNIIYLLLLINNIAINLGFGIQNYFEYQLKSKNVVIAANIANIISLILQLTAIGFKFSIIGIVIIILLSSFIKLIILFYQFKKSFDIILINRVDMSLVSSVIGESIPLAIATTAAVIYTWIGQVMIGSMLNVAEVGIFSISNQMIGVIAIAITPIQVSIYPKMIEWYNSNRDLYYKRYQALTSLATWIYIFGTTFALLLAPIVFNKLFSEVYLRSLDVFRIHVLGTFFMYNAVLRSSHFTLTKNTNVMMVSQVIAVAINITLNYIMIPKFGIFGAATSAVITQSISLFLSNLFFRNGRELFWIQLKGLNPKYVGFTEKLYNFYKRLSNKFIKT